MNLTYLKRIISAFDDNGKSTIIDEEKIDFNTGPGVIHLETMPSA